MTFDNIDIVDISAASVFFSLALLIIYLITKLVFGW